MHGPYPLASEVDYSDTRYDDEKTKQLKSLLGTGKVIVAI